MGRSLNNVKYKIDFIFFIPNVKTPIILLFKNRENYVLGVDGGPN